MKIDSTGGTVTMHDQKKAKHNPGADYEGFMITVADALVL
jgi:hypothetical protein